MPVSNCSEEVMAEPSSRKRTYAQITRSESRSTSPPPSKRRRTNIFTQSCPASFTRASPINSQPVRFVGDGLDFRRPAQTTMASSQEDGFIDLTLEDDTPPPSPSTFTSLAPMVTRSRSREIMPDARRESTPRDQISQTMSQQPNNYEIIDLASEEEDEVQQSSRTNNHRARENRQPSPEVEFVRERQLPPIPALNAPVEIRRRLPTPPVGSRRFAMGPLADIFRHATQAVLGGARNIPLTGPSRRMDYSDADLTRYEDVALDYGRPAFALGGDALVVEDPDPAENPNPDYKPPSAAREGYTRSFNDDDVLVCVACGDELATGSDEIKQQVWISKRCGHTYCGNCATQARGTTHGGNARERKKTKTQAPKKAVQFRHCKAEGCGKPLTGKTQLFQIYL